MQLLWEKAKDLGYSLSAESLINMLSEIRKAETVTITGLKGKPAKESQLEEMDAKLEKLYEDLLSTF